MPGITNPAEEYFKDGLWGWVTDQWKKLIATAGGALHIQFAGQEADVEITQIVPADLTPGVCGWSGSAWQKLPLLFGYSEMWKEDLGGDKTGDGNYQKFSLVVSPNYIYVLQAITLMNETGARGRIVLEVYDGEGYHLLAGSAAPVQYETVAWSGQLVLEAGDYAVVTQYSCLDGDALEGSAVGYKMKIAE